MCNNHPLYFVTDFYCAEKKLVIEVDGKIHDFQKEDDRLRDEILNGFDLTVLRIRNEEVEDVPLVLAKIKKFI